MKKLNFIKSSFLRRKYIKKFVDTSSNYYKYNIKNKQTFCDGRCYVGYLWDCLKFLNIITENDAVKELQSKRKIYIMWDIHTCERILIPNYWKFPKKSLLYVSEWGEISTKDLPEDIYIFDSSFAWSIVFTHEDIEPDKRYCLYSYNMKKQNQQKREANN